jgi:tRNA(fMet)-specific endonuclease VapC
MAIILDADVLIGEERGTFDLRGWLSTQIEEEFELAAITVAELLHGLERATGAHRKKRREYIDGALSSFRVVPYTARTAEFHARVWADLESRGKMIGYHDLIVAATALERGNPVATFNSRHFSAVKGLKVIQPR